MKTFIVLGVIWLTFAGIYWNQYHWHMRAADNKLPEYPKVSGLYKQPAYEKNCGGNP